MISLQLESVKEGSEQEYQLKIQQLQAQQEAELTSTEQTEEMKLAIKAKYNTKIDELATAHEQNIINKQRKPCAYALKRKSHKHMITKRKFFV